MSTCVYKEACPKCRDLGQDRHGDNLAVYSDGHKYCFKCGFTVQANPFLNSSRSVKKYNRNSNLITVPIKSKGYDWLLKYNITREEVDNFFLWDENKEQLVYRNRDFTNTRNFKYKVKAFCYGEKPYSIVGEVKPVKRIVLVEDLVSAIKVSRHYNAVPLFGTTCPSEALKQLLRVSNIITVWLDKDVLKNALKLRSYAFKQGFSVVHLLRTDLDPKCYSDQEIIDYLENGG